MPRFAAGVGEKFFLLFGVSHLVNVPQAYILFEVTQNDSYSYLFNHPRFISLDPAARPGSIVLRVQKTLRASISGAGSVEYYGDPEVRQQVSTLITQFADVDSTGPDVLDECSHQLLKIVVSPSKRAQRSADPDVHPSIVPREDPAVVRQQFAAELAAARGPVHDHTHRGGAGREELREHLPGGGVPHGGRHDAGEGGPDGRVRERGHDRGSERAQVGPEIPLIGDGYLLRRVPGHEISQQPVEAAPAPVDGGLGDTRPHCHPLHRRARIAVLRQLSGQSLQDRRPGPGRPASGPERARRLLIQSALQLR